MELFPSFLRNRIAELRASPADWLETIAAAERIGNKQQYGLFERRTAAAGADSAFSASAVVRDYKRAREQSPAGHHRMTPMGEF